MVSRSLTLRLRVKQIWPVYLSDSLGAGNLDRGFVFVSANYRFVPNVSMKQIAEDLAKAIQWVHHHAREYGGDPDTIDAAFRKYVKRLVAQGYQATPSS